MNHIYKKIKFRSVPVLLTAVLLLQLAAPAIPVLAEETSSTPAVTTEQSTSSDPLVVVDTGNSNSLTTLENEINTNITALTTATGTATTSPETGDSESTTSTEDCVLCDVPTGEATVDSSTTVNNDSQAEVENNVTGEGTSGDNAVNDNDGGVVLQTGDVELITNIFNLINTNIIAANYVQAAYNLAGQIIGELDLSRYNVQQLADEVKNNEAFQELLNEDESQQSDEDTDQAASTTVDTSLTVNSTSTAAVTSTVELDANSGDNEITDNDGPVKIITGNVVAAANLFNIVNTNIIGNGWTLAIVNIIGNWTGNLVLPSLTHPQNVTSAGTCQSGCPQLTVGNGNYDNSLTINSSNDATVTNEVIVDASSGGNEISDNNGDVTVETGDTVSLTQIINQVNTSIFGNGWVYGLVNVTGNWQGGIYGAPTEGFNVAEHPQYFTFSYQPGAADFSALLQPTGTTTPAGSVTVDNSTDINNVNQADVHNEVILHANSGGNLISGNNGDVLLKTGDVTSLVNIFNMVNSNYIGDNWTIALVNVIGNWQGGIYFGKPDLVLTEVAQPDPDPAVPGGYIDYYLTATNKGDAPATAVTLSADYDPAKVVVTEAEDGEISEHQVIWPVGTIDVGEIIVRHYRAQILPQLDGDEVGNHSQITAREDDRNPEDNTATTLVTINQGVRVGGLGFPVILSSGSPLNKQQPDYSHPMFNQQLHITKTANKELVYRNQGVQYKLEIKNNSDDSFYNVVVYDRLSGPQGEIINDQQWELGEVLPHEKIVIEYTTNFSAQAPAGEYYNLAYADGFDGQGRYSVFPYAEHRLSLSELSAATVGEYVDMSYFASAVKVVGQSAEESVLITNLAADPLPAGQVVLQYDEQYLNVDGKNTGAETFQVPSIAPGQTATVQFTTTGKRTTTGSLMTLHYLTFGQPVAVLTASYKVVSNAPITETKNTSRNLFSVGQVSTSSTGLTERNPQVLGYMKQFGDIFPPLSTNASDYFWPSLMDNTRSSWFWTLLLLTLMLLELHRRWRKDNTLFSKALGFRIF